MLKVTSKVQCDSLNFAWLAQVAKCNCGNEDYILEYKITITFKMQWWVKYVKPYLTILV